MGNSLGSPNDFSRSRTVLGSPPRKRPGPERLNKRVWLFSRRSGEAETLFPWSTAESRRVASRLQPSSPFGAFAFGFGGGGLAGVSVIRSRRVCRPGGCPQGRNQRAGTFFGAGRRGTRSILGRLPSLLFLEHQRWVRGEADGLGFQPSGRPEEVWYTII